MPAGKPYYSSLSSRIQHNLLNGQASSWSPILTDVPQGSIFGPLFFLIYRNDLSSNLSSTVELLADDKSIFSIAHDLFLKQLNYDLEKISDWAYQWKMSFNLDFSKQPQEVIFSRKASRIDQPAVTFDNTAVARTYTKS